MSSKPPTTPAKKVDERFRYDDSLLAIVMADYVAPVDLMTSQIALDLERTLDGGPWLSDKARKTHEWSGTTHEQSGRAVRFGPNTVVRGPPNGGSSIAPQESDRTPPECEFEDNGGFSPPDDDVVGSASSASSDRLSDTTDATDTTDTRPTRVVSKMRRLYALRLGTEPPPERSSDVVWMTTRIAASNTASNTVPNTASLEGRSDQLGGDRTPNKKGDPRRINSPFRKMLL